MSLEFLKNRFTRKIAAQFFVFRKAIPRSFLAMRYLRGEGIEIGALHNPVYLGPFAKAKYVDRMSANDLIIEYPELKGLNIVDPHIIDNGEQLSKIPIGSQDFIIANHFIEHCEDPIKTIKGFLERLKPEGILYLAVPDKRYTFDKERPSTSYGHLVEDHENGPLWSRESHYLEWSTYVSREADPKEAAKQLMENSYSIHFHVWTRNEFKEFLIKTIDDFKLPIEIVANSSVADEAIFLLRKCSRTVAH